MPKNKKMPKIVDNAKDEIKIIAKQILKEARKRAKHDMDCLTDLVLHEAKIVSRYAKRRPFYIV